VNYATELKREYPKLTAFFGANGIMTTEIKGDDDLWYLAEVLFELKVASRSLDVLQNAIDFLGKKERRRLRRKNLMNLPARFVSGKWGIQGKRVRRRKRKHYGTVEAGPVRQIEITDELRKKYESG
jgi:hypothetical protein